MRPCQELEKVDRHLLAMFKPHNVFLLYSISKNDTFVLKQDLAMSEYINL